MILSIFTLRAKSSMSGMDPSKTTQKKARIAPALDPLKA